MNKTKDTTQQINELTNKIQGLIDITLSDYNSAKKRMDFLFKEMDKVKLFRDYQQHPQLSEAFMTLQSFVFRTDMNGEKWLGRVKKGVDLVEEGMQKEQKIATPVIIWRFIDLKKDSALYSKLKEIVFSENKEQEVVIMKFYTDTCPPCKVLSDKLQEMNNDDTITKPKLTIISVNAKEFPELVKDPLFEIKSVPTVCFFKNGKMVDKASGIDNILKLLPKYTTIYCNACQSSIDN